MHPSDDWIVPDWPVPSRVRALVTTRNGGTSAAPYESMNLGLKVGDDPVRVAANRRLLRERLPAEPRWLDQVHGAAVVPAESVAQPPRADASFASIPGCVCAIMIADCMPVLLADRAGSMVAAAHAGWRGLAGGVLENAVARLRVPPTDVVAWLGPAIGPDAFEVGGDVHEAFVGADPAAGAAFRPHRQGKWMCDLFTLARQRLARAGVSDVHGGGLCTHSDPSRFFSHRRDGTSGRMAALVWLQD
ncbi:MAG TPA: peptidoglycan editing factor PgeF [Burkholderiales bacterium]|nr:peptidoglycan editing factor PgeF [Burkholderiales bacterium]